MDEKLGPSSKPNPNANPNPKHPRPLNATAVGPVVPTTRSLPYGATRPTHHHPPPPPFPPFKCEKNRCCIVSIFLVLLFFALIFIFAIATGIFYVIYHPDHPNFSASSLDSVSFNLTNSNQLTSLLDLTVIAYNPNTKIIFFYDPISVIASYNGDCIGGGSFAAFVHRTENTTKLKALVEGFERNIDQNTARNLKRKRSIEIHIAMDTKVRVEISGHMTKKIGVCISCGGIEVAVPNGKKTIKSHSNSNKRCEKAFDSDMEVGNLNRGLMSEWEGNKKVDENEYCIEENGSINIVLCLLVIYLFVLHF